jgi:hypothetical protein
VLACCGGGGSEEILDFERGVSASELGENRRSPNWAWRHEVGQFWMEERHRQRPELPAEHF